MYLIKRTKHSPPGAMDAICGRRGPTVQWATRAGPGPEGVTGWSADRTKAAQFERVVAEAVVALYAQRPAVGRLEIEEVEAPKEAAALPASRDDEMHAALDEIARQREVIANQCEEIDGLRRDLEQATAPDEIAGLRHDLVQARALVAQQHEELAGLRHDLEQATAPAVAKDVEPRKKAQKGKQNDPE